MSGYFLVHRGLADHPLFLTDSPFSRRESWLDLIEQANFAESIFRHKNQAFIIPRGSLGTSYRSLARRWRWSVDRVIRELKLWQGQQMIVLDTRHGYVHITLYNYDVYQAPHDTDATATRQPHDTDATQTSTNQKKEKKGKEESAGIVRMPFDELPFEWKVWVINEKGWDESIIADVWSHFCDYWRNGKGRNTKRRDWTATWHIWCRKENFQPQRNGGQYEQPKSKWQLGIDGIARARAKREQAESIQA